MKTQYIQVSSKESDDQGCQRISEGQWVSCLLIDLFQILLIFGWINFNNFRHYKQKWNRSVIFWFCIFPFLNMNLTFAVLQPSGNVEPNYMLTICDIGSANISAPSFIN